MRYRSDNHIAHKITLLALFAIFFMVIATTPVKAATYQITPGSDLIGETEVIFNDRNESFAKLAQRYSVSFSELVAANPHMDPWMPGQTNVIIPNQHILPPAPREGIVINLAELRLYYYTDGGKVVHTYPVGVGKQGWKTPTTTTRIIEKRANPEWRAPASIIAAYAQRGKPLRHVIPPGPDNPLGQFAIRLQLSNYLIHGTNNSLGVGRRVSHGCIRMYAEDIEQLFNLAPIHTTVRIIHQPTLAGVHHGRVFVAVSPPQLEYRSDLQTHHLQLLETVQNIKTTLPVDYQYQLDWHALKPLLRLQNGIPIDLTQI